jgi:DNA-binding SARP family transcriptional activator
MAGSFERSRRLEFRILGPLEVLEEDRPIPLGGAQQRALLAILLTRPNEVVSRDRLIDELWGETPPRTALNTLQYYVSQLRKLLGADRIVTQPPGYAIRVEPDELDLARFERLFEEGGGDRVREALALWRGPALADFAYEEFAQAEAARLEELRLAALERRIEADLGLGHHAELVGELEKLIAQHPVRERLRGQLMLALYRSGRQAEALDAYQATRKTLVDELGIEPSQAVQELERAILRHDPGLDLAAPSAPQRSILVAPRDERKLAALLALAEPLARTRPPRELILARLISAADLASAAALLNEHRAALSTRGIAARAAAFISAEPGTDLVRLASEQDVDLVLLDCAPEDDVIVGDLGAVLAEAPCDVALLVGGGADGPDPGPERPVFVPFGGADHDWAAVEVAAWIAGASGAALRLVGAEGDPGKKKRDASRLLASASLLVQRAVGIATEPLLVPRGAEGIVAAAGESGLIVSGLSVRWRQEGLGVTRLAVASQARPPTLLVRRGLRPAGIAPQESLTRFTWSLTTAGRSS